MQFRANLTYASLYLKAMMMIRKIFKGVLQTHKHVLSRHRSTSGATLLLAMERRLAKSQESIKVDLVKSQESLKVDLVKAQESLKMDLAKAQENSELRLGKAQESLKVDLVKAQESLKMDLAKAQENSELRQGKAQESIKMDLGKAQESIKVDLVKAQESMKAFIKSREGFLFLQLIAAVSAGMGIGISGFYWAGGDIISPWKPLPKHNQR